jgi:hypothetical protein
MPADCAYRTSPECCGPATLNASAQPSSPKSRSCRTLRGRGSAAGPTW